MLGVCMRIDRRWLCAGLLWVVPVAFGFSDREAPGEITEEQRIAFLNYLNGGSRNLAFTQGLPAARSGELDPIEAFSGLPCILPDENESFHSVIYTEVRGGSEARVVFGFTVSPAVRSGVDARSVGDILAHRLVTQYWVRVGPNEPRVLGKMIDLRSRSSEGCLM